MEPCLHSPSYAHSSEMYTHVGTMVRSQKQKKSCRGPKEKKKNKEEGKEAGVSGGKSQWEVGEHVQHSPLLSALSTLSLTSPDRPEPVSVSTRPLPAPPTSSSASPMTSAPDPPVETPQNQKVFPSDNDALQTDKSVSEPLNMALTSSRGSSSQDLYVPMDPVAEAAHSYKEDSKERQRGNTAQQDIIKTAKSMQNVGNIIR